MKRREFITLLGGAAASPLLWPSTVRAQQGGPMRRVGVLYGTDENDPSAKERLAAFTQTLAGLGWADGRNLRMDVRWAAGNIDRMRMFARELVGLRPDAIAVTTPEATRTVQRQTQTIPIVFMGVGDPVAGGLLASISRPEGNSTGITNYFPSFSGKWLELLKEALPRLARVALVFYPEISTGAYFASAEAAAAQYAVTAIRTPVRDAAEFERTIEAFAAEPNGGLIVLPPAPDFGARALIYRLAAQHRLPAIAGGKFFASEGGLMAYGPDNADTHRRGASYVDRILRGAKPGDLPVQFPTKFELVINLKTAKAMGLTISEAFLLRADELIE